MSPRASAESKILGLGQGTGQRQYLVEKVRRQDQQKNLSNIIYWVYNFPCEWRTHASTDFLSASLEF